MTENAKDAWAEVGDRFSAWGKRVADRYREQGDAATAGSDEADDGFSRAVKDVVDELTKGVKALGGTIKDKEANAELSDAVSALGTAITASVTEAADSTRSKGDPPAAPPPPAPGG